jgi:hypothetical protein
MQRSYSDRPPAPEDVSLIANYHKELWEFSQVHNDPAPAAKVPLSLPKTSRAGDGQKSVIEPSSWGNRAAWAALYLGSIALVLTGLYLAMRKLAR